MFHFNNCFNFSTYQNYRVPTNLNFKTVSRCVKVRMTIKRVW
jgi:hypothetical protein